VLITNPKQSQILAAFFALLWLSVVSPCQQTVHHSVPDKRMNDTTLCSFCSRILLFFVATARYCIFFVLLVLCPCLFLQLPFRQCKPFRELFLPPQHPLTPGITKAANLQSRQNEYDGISFHQVGGRHTNSQRSLLYLHGAPQGQRIWRHSLFLWEHLSRALPGNMGAHKTQRLQANRLSVVPSRA
jgi:hypothetical protein